VRVLHVDKFLYRRSGAEAYTMHSKSVTPLLQAEPGASRVFVSACSEGAGHHGLFLFVGAPRRQRPLHLARTVAARLGAVSAMVVGRLRTR
jgi:hypothetical protein